MFLNLTIPRFPNSSFPAFSQYSLSWSDVLITQWVKKKDAGVAPQNYHICTATQNSVLLGQCMPSSETHSFGEPSSSLPVLKARSCYQTSYCGQHRLAFSLRRSVNRKGRGTGSEQVTLYTFCARVVCRKYSCKSLWGMTTERTKSSAHKY